MGADGLTFSDINGGKPYLEDYTYSKEIRITTLDCSSFTNPYQMKEFTAMRLAEYCKPTVSYVLNAMDLSVLTGYEHEAWNLGDYVRVEDKELGLSVTTRIVRREYNLQEPWNTVLELSLSLIHILCAHILAQGKTPCLFTGEGADALFTGLGFEKLGGWTTLERI